jgi:hypothetical protein
MRLTRRQQEVDQSSRCIADADDLGAKPAT